MTWWGWVIIGAMLLGAELGFIDTGFYLVFIGLSGIVVGLVGLGGLSLPAWGQWLLFAGLSLTSMILFRGKVYRLLRPDGPGFENAATGENLRIPERIEPGETCRVNYRGTSWTARNEGSEPIAAGETARIERVESLLLLVYKAD